MVDTTQPSLGRRVIRQLDHVKVDGAVENPYRISSMSDFSLKMRNMR